MKSTIKSIIIRISIAFLIIVALLTYFSGTIDNYLLPHVSVTFGGEGSLKYDLQTVSVFEENSSDYDDSETLCFRFECEKELDHFVQMGSLVSLQASVEVAENEYALREGAAVIVEKREAQDGIECTAELKKMDIAGDEKMPAVGDEVLIDTEFESQPYRHIVMKSAIQNGSFVYLVTKDADEKRYVHEVPVTILEESDFYAAVEMSGDSLPIVLSSTKEIHDGQRVIVDG